MDWLENSTWLTWTFAQLEWLWGWAVVVLGAALQLYFARRRSNHYGYSSLQSLPSSGLGKVRSATFVLAWAALGMLLTAMARPQSSTVVQRASQNLGIDMVLAVDISASMLAKDLKPNRLEALKEVATRFVNRRTTDRLGLVIYAGEAYSPVPLTTDHRLLNKQIESLRYDLLEQGTAIGMGLATAVNRLQNSTAKSKVVILLTDGENNAGLIDPTQAADLAKSTGVKVYTIGLGTNGVAPTPVGYDQNNQLVYRPQQVRIDEELLQRIAQTTGGQYFRATDNESLDAIYGLIDQLEKSEIEGYKFYRYTEHYHWFVFAALGLIALELLLNFVIVKTAF